MKAILAKNLTRKFGDIIAVDNFSIEINTGEIFGLVGPDGAGKTTIMRLLTSIMDPSSGDAWVDGHHILTEGEKVKEKIGYMSQSLGLYNDLTVLENLTFYSNIFGLKRSERTRRIEELLAFSHLTQFQNRLTQNLSGGMRQKLGLACALVHSPKVLFLDEPTSGVDPVSRREFWNILYDLLTHNVTIFLSTSYLDEAERCHRVALIHKGKIFTSGAPNLLEKSMIQKVLEITTHELRLGAGLLRKYFGIENVGIYGGTIHLLTDDTLKATHVVWDVFNHHNIPYSKIVEIEPSLEDLFMYDLGGTSER